MIRHASVLALLFALAACAPQPEAPPPAYTEYRCVRDDGAMAGSNCVDGRTNCRCEAGTGRLTLIPACNDRPESAHWHDPIQAERGRAARDGSFIGDRDETGLFCLPAPPS